MCLAMPARILKLNGERAHVDYEGLELDIDVSLVPEARVGDFVIVHVGIALSVMNVEEAEVTRRAHQELTLLYKKTEIPS